MSREERIHVAVDNWAPRFVANGVDFNDLQRIARRVERWDGWCREWYACGAQHARLGETTAAAECCQAVAQHYFQAAIAVAGAYCYADHFDRLSGLTRDAFTFRLKAPDQSAALAILERLDLTGVLPRIACPLLVIMGRKDRLVPPESAEQMARDAGGHVELWLFDEGNHVCYNIPYLYRPQQTDWSAGCSIAEPALSSARERRHHHRCHCGPARYFSTRAAR